jgi:hypothetical protein
VWFLITCLYCTLHNETDSFNAIFKLHGSYVVALVGLTIWTPLLVGFTELLLSVNAFTAVVLISKATVFGFGEYLFQWITCYNGYARGLLKRKYPSPHSFLAIECVDTDRRCSTGFRRDDMKSLVVGYMSSHIFPAAQVLELLTIYVFLSALKGTATLWSATSLFVFVLVGMAPLLYNPCQTWRTTRAELQQLSKYLIFSPARERIGTARMQTPTPVRWATVDFDKPESKIIRNKSFAHAYLYAFFREQDAWSKQLILWLCWGGVKITFVTYVIRVASIKYEMLQATLLLWFIYGWLRLLIIATRLHFGHALYATIFGVGAMISAATLAVLTCLHLHIRTGPILYNFIASVWLVSMLLRQSLGVCMQLSSLLIYWRALRKVRKISSAGAGEKSRALSRAFEAQEQLYWCLDSIFAMELMRVVSGACMWCMCALGSVFSVFVWKFFVSAPASSRLERKFTLAKQSGHTVRTGTLKDQHQLPRYLEMTERSVNTPHRQRLATRQHDAESKLGLTVTAESDSEGKWSEASDDTDEESLLHVDRAHL